MRKGVVLVVLVSLLIPAASFAAIFEDGKNSFELTAPLIDDLYVVGERVDIGQTVSEDVFAAGELVVITAAMGADVYAAGGTVRISGNVGDDLHAAGREVEVGGHVAGDVFAAGQNLQLNAGTTIARDVYAAGENITLAGTVQGTVRAAGRVTVASGARIAGDLKVYSNEAPIIEEGATIEGEVSVEAPPKRPEAGKKLFLLGWVRSVMAMFVVALVMVYGARAFSRNAAETAGKQAGKSLLTAAIWMLLFIPASILLLITLVGIPLAAGVVLLTILLCLAASGITAAGVGRWVLGKLSRDAGTELSWVHALVGAVVYKALPLVPVIGWLAALVLTLIFFGATVLTLFKFLRSYDKSNPASPGPTSP